MFCCECGARIPDEANYCYKCGVALRAVEAPRVDRGANVRVSDPAQASQNVDERRLIEELLSIDQKSQECHACGASENLYRWEFGLGKRLSTKMAWSEAAWSVAVSAVTIPLVGAGALQLPGKKVSYRVLRLCLVLCGDCWEGEAKYGLHPWWRTATKLGYTEFFDVERLANLEPVR